MSIALRIDRCALVTDAGEYEFHFNRACTVLDGPVGTGKSSLFELLKYGLGGGAVLTPVVRAEVRRVIVDVRMNGQRVRLTRPIGAGSDEVAMTDVGTGDLLGIHPVRPRVNQTQLSEQLLAMIGFPLVRIPRSRTRATGANVPLTFNDLYSYLYVEQSEIDRSVVFHREPFREPKRRALFELMFQLSSEQQLEYETRLGALSDKIRASQTHEKAITDFLETANVPPRIELERRIAEQRAHADRAIEDLTAIRHDVHAQTGAYDELRQRLRDLEAELLKASERVVEAEVEIRRREELLAQLNVNLQREDKAASAALRLSPLEFVVCPRCMQDIEADRTDHEHCTLCLQPTATLEQFREELDPAFEQTAIQMEEQEQLLEEAKQDLSERRSDFETTSELVEAARDELGRATSAAVTPRFDEIELLSSARARAEAAIGDSRRSLAFWLELDEVRRLTAEHEGERDRIRALLEEERSDLRAQSDVIEDLSHQFREIVREIGIPWATDAWIDDRTYLPIINGDKFEDLAVAGGTLTTVTVAYHLTLLGYAMAQPGCLLPALLVIDTPRKNLGTNQDDREMGDKIYRHVRSLCDLHGDRIQFIIADNDVPTAPDWFGKIHVDYDQPLLPHVTHPGEDAVKSGAVPLVGANRES